MTRKHYVALASILAAADLDVRQRLLLAQQIACMLAADNPRFDSQRFIAAATNIAGGVS